MTPKRLLIIKLRHHGDVLLTTPLFKACTELFPGVAVDTLIYHETLPLLENNPHINQIHSINRKIKGFKRLKHEWCLLRQIQQVNYDSVIHLTDQWVGALIARISGAKTRVHLCPPKRQNNAWRHCFTHSIEPPARGRLHATALNLLSLKAFGVDPTHIQPEVVLKPNTQAQLKANALLNNAQLESGFILVHPAARWPFKCWSDAKFAAIIAALLNRGLNVVLTSSPSQFEKSMTARIEQLARQESFNQGRLVNLAGQTDLPTLAALQQQCRFYIGVDSAPMHMAAALNVPQIALFGPSWLNEWKPFSEQAITIYAGDFGELPHPDSINTDDEARLLDAIPVETVLDNAMLLIEKTANRYSDNFAALR